jgi:hypothetical protein
LLSTTQPDTRIFLRSLDLGEGEKNYRVVGHPDQPAPYTDWRPPSAMYHQRDQICGQAAGVVSARCTVEQVDPARVDRDYGEAAGKGGHQLAPGEPVLRPSGHETQQRPVAAHHGVQAAGMASVRDRPVLPRPQLLGF